MDNDMKASWERLCDTLKESADYIFDPALGVDSSEKAEGLRHHLRLLSGAVERLLENDDPEHPELGWTYPAKMGQDNPDAFYMSAPIDLHHSYRLTGRMDTPRYLDYVNLPATLNDSQAQIDPDGVLRVVISHQDPGVVNWIALGGCPQGAITYRWNNADTVPVPSLRLMSVSELADQFHPDTPHVSPQARRQRQTERRRHALERFTR